MAGERGKLTDLRIRHWVKAGVPLVKADGGGLTFTLSAGGSADWILRYGFGGGRRELTVGRHPDIGPAEARGIAAVKRAQVQQGRNPAAAKPQGQGHSRTRLDGARAGHAGDRGRYPAILPSC